MIVNLGIRSRKMPNLQLQIRELADKKTAYNEVCLYLLASWMVHYYLTDQELSL
jgi:hypothetical protein